MRQILRISARDDPQPAVGKDDERTSFQRAPYEIPFKRYDLLWPVNDRVAQDGRARMQRQDLALGLGDSPGKSAVGVGFGLHRRLGLGGRDWHAGGKERFGREMAAGGGERSGREEA